MLLRSTIVESSDAALLAAQANVREAELNLSYTKVTAPISGITGRALHSDATIATVFSRPTRKGRRT